MNKKTARGLIYAAGIVTLAFGLILNTKCALGTSAIISIAYVIAEITGMTIGDATLIEYSILVAIEIMVHMYLKKDKKIFVMDALQFPFTIVFSRMMNVFSAMIPSLAGAGYALRIGVLMIAIIFTALGASTMLDMKLIPNPGDGIVAALSELIGKEIGLTKNIFDTVCLCITVMICLLSGHAISGIGIGTVLAIIGVGRFISLFNKLFKAKLTSAAGL